MTLVHGSDYSRWTSLEVKRLLRFEAFLFCGCCSIYQMCHCRDQSLAPGPGARARTIGLQEALARAQPRSVFGALARGHGADVAWFVGATDIIVPIRRQ